MSETTSTDSTTSESTDTADEGKKPDTADTTQGSGPAADAKTGVGVPPEVRRALNTANKEAEKLRRELKAFQDRDKTELQKAQERADAAEKRAAELETGRKADKTRTAIIAAAATAGAVDPEAVYRLMDLDTLTTDDDGAPTNASSAVAKVLKDKPYLGGRTATTEARDRGEPAKGSDMSAQIRRAAGFA